MNPEIDDQKEYTIEEYLAMEEVAEARHEYNNGYISKVDDSTVRHAIINSNLLFFIHNYKKENNIEINVFSSNLKVYLDKYNSFVYPDTFVVKGHINTSHNQYAVTNPTLIIEIVSNETESYDRGKRFLKYRSLSSLKEYIIIDQYQPIVDVFYEIEGSQCKLTMIDGLDQSIYINTLDCKIPMSTIYKNVTNLINPALRLDV